MHAERFNSAYRLALGIVLVYVLWMIVPHAIAYAKLIGGGARRSQNRAAVQRQNQNVAQHQNQNVAQRQNQKLSAPQLVALLVQTNQVAPNAELQCKAARRDWDYVCTYMPKPLESPTRLQFGLNVDATRWTKVSRHMPMGAAVLPPQ
jgi:hypothetical protein